jgi:hypothetical protein
MTVHHERSLHPIRVLHVLACVGLAFGFACYAWQHHPIRRVSRAQASRIPVARRTPHRVPSFAGDLSARLDLVQAVLPDLVGGLGVLLLLSLGTGIYVRRFEVWLEAHQAGEAAAIRGVGLDQAALGANKDRKKGATL